MVSMHKVSPSYVVTSFLVLTGTCLKPSPSPQSLPLFPRACLLSLTRSLSLHPAMLPALMHPHGSLANFPHFSLIPCTATVPQRPHHSPPSLPTRLCPTKQALLRQIEPSRLPVTSRMLSPLITSLGREWVPKQAFPLLAGCPVSGPPWISLGQGAQPWPGSVMLAEGSFLWAIVPCSSQDVQGCTSPRV